MEHVEESKKRGRGRPRKDDIKKYSLMIRLNDKDNDRFMTMYKQSKARSVSQFIADKVLNHQLKIIEINKSALDFVMLLTQFFAQMRGIKNNYNQLFTFLVKKMGEDKARKILRIIEQSTLDFIHLWKELEIITQHLRDKWLPK